jgi:peptidoglycan/xylan/chitin deacetylase (PgdA/CDA1 family)
VLVYHRVADLSAPDFDTFRPTVSASPDAFATQLDFVTRYAEPVSLQDVIDAAAGRLKLPPRAVLVTFDDGYRDNVDVALPLLRARRVPAVLFLTTGCLAGTCVPFFWDHVAYLLHHARVTSATLPLVGSVSWPTPEQRHALTRHLVELLKWLPEAGRRVALRAIARAVDVAVSPRAFDEVYMTWDDARRATAGGLAVGSHTVTHPILTTVDTAQARHELVASRRDLQRELGVTAQAFAFPNGNSDGSHDAFVREAGYAVAFAGVGGPIRIGRLRAQPFAVRRIPVSNRDSLATFAAKLAGLNLLSRAVSRTPRPRAASPDV